jgi:hypothetical protein
MSEYRRPRDLAEAEAAARAGVLEGQKAGTSIWEPCDANLGDDDFWCANPASERHRVPVSFSAPEPLTGTPRWVEPEGTPEQIADACVAHLAAGGRVDLWHESSQRWYPTATYEAYDIHTREGHRFALVYSDPPQPERPSATDADGNVWTGGMYTPPEYLRPQPDRVPAPEGVTDLVGRLRRAADVSTSGGGEWHQLAHRCREAADYIEKHLPVDRVAAPEGVTVIGWTEPTDDEPRQLPIVWGNDIPDEGWERNGYGDPPGHFRTYGEPRGDASYIIRPIPSPPVPETERVRLDQIVGRRLPGKSWAVTEFGFDPMDGYVAQGHPSDDDLLPIAGFVVHPDGCVFVLPLDGTDGD